MTINAAPETGRTKDTKLTYQQTVNRIKFNRECGVVKMERYDDCILLTTGSGLTTKVSLGFFKTCRPMTVIEGNAP